MGTAPALLGSENRHSPNAVDQTLAPADSVSSRLANLEEQVRQLHMMTRARLDEMATADSCRNCHDLKGDSDGSEIAAMSTSVQLLRSGLKRQETVSEEVCLKLTENTKQLAGLQSLLDGQLVDRAELCERHESLRKYIQDVLMEERKGRERMVRALDARLENTQQAFMALIGSRLVSVVGSRCRSTTDGPSDAESLSEMNSPRDAQPPMPNIGAPSAPTSQVNSAVSVGSVSSTTGGESPRRTVHPLLVMEAALSAREERMASPTEACARGRAATSSWP
eukprot:NODE_1175_length_1220_cov_229.391416.p2 GENE.NODE_1175_length_1220_cov_229.391416~~NODE_1175_length_1220_cov_229.391416.p2  ORF type:complete len:280 (+),score=56.35 NODE_1175_length_1220_cov_229.391416:3-842(+)